MTNLQDIRESPLEHLDYFAEWGGAAWTRLIRTGLVDYLGGDLSGKRVLDFGSRNGRMSCLLGLLGAQVTGLEIHQECVEIGRAEAAALGVSDNVEFMCYSGDLKEMGGREYEVIFTKSVLVMVPDLQPILEGLEPLLAVSGQTVFVENARGGPFIRLTRRLRHSGRWNYSYVNYLSTAQLELIESYFDIVRMKDSWLPPIRLLCGWKKSP